MTKSGRSRLVSLVLAVASFLSVLPAPAQDDANNQAVAEAVRRQAYTLDMRQKLAQAQEAYAAQDLAKAAKLYSSACDLSQRIGSGVEAETKAAVNGLVACRTQLAQQAQARHDYREAQTQISDALRVDPKNAAAIEFKKQNDALLAANAGRMPSREAVESLSVTRTNLLTSKTLVQDGKLYLDMGRLDDAEVKLKQAIILDPDNQAAFYYLSLVKEAKYGRAQGGKDLAAKTRLLEIEQDWLPPVKRDLLPQPNPYATTNLVFTGSGRQAIIGKLNRIRLSETPKNWDNMELNNVLTDLRTEAAKRDPDQEGINFLIASGVSAGAAAQQMTIDPNTGQAVPVAAPAGGGEQEDIGAIKVHLTPPLRNVRLADVLDAIAKTAEKPIKSSIEDYAVIFSLRTAETVPLYTRTFNVDPNTFVEGLQQISFVMFGTYGGNMMGGGMGGMGGGMMGGMGGGMGGMGGGGGGMQGVMQGSGFVPFVTMTNSQANIQLMVREFFTANGVNFQDPAAPGKTLFFNDRLGKLFVRATLTDLDIIEAAVQTLNAVPPQVNIKAKFAEISQQDDRALGFDWYFGNFTTGGGAVGAQAGTAPSFNGAPTPQNPNGVFPGSPATAAGGTATTIGALPTDQILTSGLRNTAPALGTITGILTDPQFRVVIHALEQRQGVQLLNAPEVTTLSGRQAQIKATDIKTIAVDISGSQAGYGGGYGGGGYGGGGYGGGGYGGGVVSDRNLKTNFTPVDAQAVLAKVSEMPITSWSYKAEGDVRHVGPMAQDFYAAFGLGDTDRRIAVVDQGGVALAAIQGLNQKLEEKDAKIKALETQLSELKALVETLAARTTAGGATQQSVEGKPLATTAKR